MKKWIAFVFIVLLCAYTAYAATFVTIATGTTGGTYYPAGAAMAKIFNAHVPGVRSSAQSTGGTVQNIRLMGKGKAEAIFADGLYLFAYQGKGIYTGKAQKFLRGMAPLYPEPVHFLAARNSGIKTVRDLKGKRVSIGAVGSGTEVTARALLEAAGLNPDKDIRAEHLGLSDTAAALADRHIDAGAAGTAGIVEITTLNTAELLSLDPDTAAALERRLPYYVPYTIPSGSYRNNKSAIRTLASWNILAVTEKLDAKTVYAMTKALFEHKKELVNAAARMTDMRPENVQHIRIPLHPGAERYYRELKKTGGIGE